ncbi:MAG: DoxX family protein [Nonomuraea sp.]|nr:DoxX family protein [Nonomuraea sp.]
MRQALRDLAALVARVGVGGIFFANGWLKLERGLTATGVDFANRGAPAPGAWATVTMLVELLGGALLIAGFAVPAVGVVLFLEALSVFVVARELIDISLTELVLLGITALLLAVVGAGRISVDHMVVIRRRESEAADEFAADTEADRVIASLREPEERKKKELEDTAPHPRPARRTEPEEATAPTPGDTLVAGRKKPQARNRRTSTAD